jgi:hypothetical protein
MKKILNILALAITALIIASCLHIEKRNHRSGYYVEWIGKPGKSPQKIPLSAKDSTQDIKYNSIIIDSRTISLADNFCTPIPAPAPKSNRNLPLKQIAHSIPNNATEERPKINQNRSGNFSNIWTFSLGMGISIIGLTAYRKKAKKVSKWATKNKKKSQLLLGLSLTILTLLSTASGWFSDLMSKEEGIVFLAISSILLISGATLHYFKKGKYFISRLAIMLFLGGLLGQSHIIGQHLQKKHPQTRDYTMQKATKTMNVLTNNTDDAIQKKNEAPAIIAFKIFLTIGTIIIGVVILIVAAMLSCELSCAGATAAANFVIAFGTLFAIGLTVLLLYFIWKPWSQKKEAEKVFEEANDEKPTSDSDKKKETETEETEETDKADKTERNQQKKSPYGVSFWIIFISLLTMLFVVGADNGSL